ncbi:MAG: Serine/threonine-protein kinase pkn1 [Verrucomicrobiota bacterium]|jgi:formylglycine-generating enzyme required for sulfatase activity
MKELSKENQQTLERIRREKELKERLERVPKLRPLQVIIPVGLLLVVIGLSVTFSLSADKKPRTSGNPLMTAKGREAPLIAKPALPADLEAVPGARLVDVPEKIPLDGVREALKKQEECSLQRGLPVEVKNRFGISFRLVPEGSFLMGSPPSEAGRTDLEELHSVHIAKPFYMSVTEVTQEQWHAVMSIWAEEQFASLPGLSPEQRLIVQTRLGEIGRPAYQVVQKGMASADPSIVALCQAASLDIARRLNDDPYRPDYAAAWISFLDCQEFLRILNRELGLAPYTYSFASEEQWEYACRAGTTTPWSFGSSFLDSAHYMSCQETDSVHLPAGSRAPNAWGLRDLHGGLYEWTGSPIFHYECGPEFFADDGYPEGDLPIVNSAGEWASKENFRLARRTKGIQQGIYFIDRNKDGGFNLGEMIFADDAVVSPGTFEPGKDLVIFNGGITNQKPETYAGERGITGKLRYQDINENSRWDKGEPVWQTSMFLRSGDAGWYAVRGGRWSDKMIDCRSALRYKFANTSRGPGLGLRLVRNLHDAPAYDPSQP